MFWLLYPRHRLCDNLAVLNRAQAAWFLKAKSLAEEARIDEAEMEDEGIAEMLIDENATAQVPRPGTSFTRPVTGSGPSQGVRPMSKGGRPVSGYLRPGTQGGRPSTVEAAMRGRTAMARPVTSASGRFVRLGTVRICCREFCAAYPLNCLPPPSEGFDPPCSLSRFPLKD